MHTSSVKAVSSITPGGQLGAMLATYRKAPQLPFLPDMIRRKKRFRWTKALYRERSHVATRNDKLGASFPAFIQLAAVRISLRLIEYAP
jgi:hypothetical protein